MIKRTSVITSLVVCFTSFLFGRSAFAAFYQPVYGAAQTYRGFDYTTSITSGDIDGDGDKDLLATRLFDDKVSVLLNDGSGHFTVADTYDTAHWPYQVTLADMNGDGDLDIVTANQGNQSSQIYGNVSILLNDGDGTFAAHHDYGTGPASRSVAIADFDNDGDLDVATGNILSDGDRPASVTTYLNDGAGILSHETYYPRHGTSYVTAADVNHDGLVDLAVTNSSDLSASIFLNRGNATFGNEEVYILGTAAVAPELHHVHSSSFADLDNDGDLDWVIGNRNIDKLTFLYNDGYGRFSRRMECGASVPQFEYIYDFNKDGILDVMTVNHDSSSYNSVSILLGLSNGMYSKPVIVPMGTATIEATVGDFNRDNRLDLATSDYFGNSVTAKLLTGLAESNLDTTSNNCVMLPNITSFVPFLTLPVKYDGTSQDFVRSLQGSIDGAGPGRVWTWFDHTSPTYSENQDMTIWSGNQYSGLNSRGFDKTNRYTCDTGISCYDGHSGIDFERRKEDEPILAAASGSVAITITGCIEGDYSCGNHYGNQVWINHHNGFATLYAHLKSVLVNKEDNPVSRGQTIGIMGNTGNSGGTHLHFGLYFDKNNDGQWSTENEAVDPFGWAGQMVDPWETSTGMISLYLWKFPLTNKQVVETQGGTVSSASGNVTVTVPAEAFSTTTTVVLQDTIRIADPPATLKSIGYSFSFKLFGSQANRSALNIFSNAYKLSKNPLFSQPITVTVKYEDSTTRHLNREQLILYRYDTVDNAWLPLQTTVNIGQKEVTASTTESGNFDLQAPLLCPNDVSEPDDVFNASTLISFDTGSSNRLFDSSGDEDWFKFSANPGDSYLVKTINLASGVETSLELRDIDGSTILASNDDFGSPASQLEWIAPKSGMFFIRVAGHNNSLSGCTATYQLKLERVAIGKHVYLPVIMR